VVRSGKATVSTFERSNRLEAKIDVESYNLSLLIKVNHQSIRNLSCLGARPRLQLDIEAIRVWIIMEFH
jgi:hypothetical protein